MGVVRRWCYRVRAGLARIRGRGQGSRPEVQRVGGAWNAPEPARRGVGGSRARRSSVPQPVGEGIMVSSARAVTWGASDSECARLERAGKCVVRSRGRGHSFDFPTDRARRTEHTALSWQNGAILFFVKMNCNRNNARALPALRVGRRAALAHARASRAWSRARREAAGARSIHGTPDRAAPASTPPAVRYYTLQYDLASAPTHVHVAT